MYGRIVEMGVLKTRPEKKQKMDLQNTKREHDNHEASEIQ